MLSKKLLNEDDFKPNHDSTPMKRLDINSLIFIDGGNPQETLKARELLGYIDGQTTNPTLISRNPEEAKRITEGKKVTREEAYSFYKKIIKGIAEVTSGPISIEVYADKNTKAEEMIKQGREMFSWIPNGFVKFPITKEGLKASELAVSEGLRVNMTLCFSQEQGAAVYAATRKTETPVFISPFVGRLDDEGDNGMDLVKNLLKMFGESDGHVHVLTASVRNINHLFYALKLKSEAITVPLNIFQEWAARDFRVPGDDYQYNAPNLKPIPYQEISLKKPWQEYNISHPLTDIGIERFSADWEKMVE